MCGLVGYGPGPAENLGEVGLVAAVGAQYHVGVEDFQQSFEVGVLCRGEKSIDHSALSREVAVRGHRSLDPLACPAGELSDRVG